MAESARAVVKVRDREEDKPAYQRIQDAIRQRIERGELTPGAPVDSERELARIHGVSPMTARHALAELQREGLVERHRGAGTFVAPPKIQFNKLTGFTENMASRSLPARSRMLSSTITDAEHDVSAKLGLSPTSRLVVVQRLRLGGNEPFALETCYLAAEEFGELVNAPLERGSIFGALEREHGIQLVHADEEIDATTADAKTAELMDIPRGAPLLRIRQLIYSSQGRAVLYVYGLYRSDRHTLRIRRFR
jgi:GntR family transcriptional regulator